MTIFSLLKKDHKEVKAMIKKLQKEESPGARKKLFSTIKRELTAHSHAEEQVLYNRLEESGKERAELLGFEGGIEHKIVENLLGEIDAMSADSVCFEAGVKVLKELLEEHISEEESDLFSQAKKVLDSDEIKTMAEEFERLKKRELDSPAVVKRPARDVYSSEDQNLGLN